MKVHSRAGELPAASDLVDVSKLIAAYYENHPDVHVAGQRVVFGTSGHRGSSFENSFNEDHILAMTQAICFYRKLAGIEGPLYLGIDTHALSRPASVTALEVLAANDVIVMLAAGDEFTPTPVISHAILSWNRDRKSGLADGIVITPSHNPPESGGFKYDPPHGGPAEGEITSWIEAKANEILENGLKDVKRIPEKQALSAATTRRHDYRTAYIDDLNNVIDMDAIKTSGLTLGVDPLGGAGVHYWPRIAEKYSLNLTIANDSVDPTFRFMTLDWDGRIRMDPSSPYAMQSLIRLKDKFDVAFACDTDHDRHGIVARSHGLLPPNHYLAVSVDYLFSHRTEWRSIAAVGKTTVSSTMIDRVAAKVARQLYEVPVGFKYFVDGLFRGTLGFGGEESAGASFLRRDGRVWTTDKDGIIAALLAAEITAQSGKDPGEIYAGLTRELGSFFYDRTDAPANPLQKAALAKMSRASIQDSELAGAEIVDVLTDAPGDGKAIGGVKVISRTGWFAARPSGTEDIYKIYAESFDSAEHLERIKTEAQKIVSSAFASMSPESCK